VSQLYAYKCRGFFNETPCVFHCFPLFDIPYRYLHHSAVARLPEPKYLLILGGPPYATCDAAPVTSVYALCVASLCSPRPSGQWRC
jgi:hypothetical protein